MERVNGPSPPLFKKPLDHTVVELHLETRSEGYSIVPYVCLQTSQGPRIKKAQLQGIPPSLTFDQIGQAVQVLHKALVCCREYLDDPVVEVLPRGLGGMKQGALGPEPSKGLDAAEAQPTPQELPSDLPLLIDEEETKPSNSNSAPPPSLETGGESLRGSRVERAEQRDLGSDVTRWQQALIMAMLRGDDKLVGIASCCLGLAYDTRGAYRKAVKYHEQHLAIAKKLKDRAWEGQASGNLGAAYQALAEYRRAIDYHKQHLAIANELGNRAWEGGAYSNLGIAYRRLGEYRHAIDCHEQHLAIAKELNDRAWEGIAYSHLGGAYQMLGEYRRAIDYDEQHLGIARELKDVSAEMKAYGNLGVAYYDLRMYREAIAYHEENLALAQELKDRTVEGTTYGNIGVAYTSLGEYRRAIGYHKKHGAIAKELGDSDGEGRAYGNLGHAYDCLGDYRKAIKYHEKHLASAKEVGERDGEGRAYGNIGVVYMSLGEYRTAIEYHKKHLAIAEEIEHREGQGTAHHNLGDAYQYVGKLSSSEDHFRQAVACYSGLQEDLGAEHQGWQISIFEGQARSYLQLKDVLIAQRKVDEALSLADFGRSRALASFVGGSLGEEYVQQATPIEDMQVLAGQLETTFVVIAANFSNASSYYAWVVSAEKKMSSTELTLADPKSLDVSFQVSGTRSKARDARSLQMHRWASQICEGAEEELRVVVKQKPSSESRARALPTFYDKYSSSLQALYRSLIAPLEEYLPEEGGSITILPDTNLQKIPFAALMSDRTHYLIEKWDISTAPSIEVLKLLAIRAQKYSANDGKCVLSDPKGHAEAPDLKYASDEAATLVEQLGAEHYAHGSVTKELTTGQAEKAGLIHLVCHGDPTKSESPHSVFRGILALADGDWYASEIGKMSLKADLVFMSACGTGKGTEMREGVIGLSRSFLASGASSVIATHWSIQDRSAVPVVKAFYQRLLEHGNKAKALREAMLSVIDKWRYHPEKWGAFFLVGLPFVATDGPLQPAQCTRTKPSGNSNSNS